MTHLVLNQRQKRRTYDGDPPHDHGGKLVTQRFAPARGHQHETVLPGRASAPRRRPRSARRWRAARAETTRCRTPSGCTGPSRPGSRGPLRCRRLRAGPNRRLWAHPDGARSSLGRSRRSFSRGRREVFLAIATRLSPRINPARTAADRPAERRAARSSRRAVDAPSTFPPAVRFKGSFLVAFVRPGDLTAARAAAHVSSLKSITDAAFVFAGSSQVMATVWPQGRPNKAVVVVVAVVREVQLYDIPERVFQVSLRDGVSLFLLEFLVVVVVVFGVVVLLRGVVLDERNGQSASSPPPPRTEIRRRGRPRGRAGARRRPVAPRGAASTTGASSESEAGSGRSVGSGMGSRGLEIRTRPRCCVAAGHPDVSFAGLGASKRSRSPPPPDPSFPSRLRWLWLSRYSRSEALATRYCTYSSPMPSAFMLSSA